MPSLTSRQFNQDLALAKRLTEDGPVIITDRGQPRHVLMRYETYLALSPEPEDIAALLAFPEGLSAFVLNEGLN